jgi:hypothetical protein
VRTHVLSRRSEQHRPRAGSGHICRCVRQKSAALEERRKAPAAADARKCARRFLRNQIPRILSTKQPGVSQRISTLVPLSRKWKCPRPQCRQVRLVWPVILNSPYASWARSYSAAVNVWRVSSEAIDHLPNVRIHSNGLSSVDGPLPPVNDKVAFFVKS